LKSPNECFTVKQPKLYENKTNGSAKPSEIQTSLIFMDNSLTTGVKEPAR